MAKTIAVALFQSEGEIEPFARLCPPCAFYPEVIVWGNVAFTNECGRNRNAEHMYVRTSLHVVEGLPLPKAVRA